MCVLVFERGTRREEGYVHRVGHVCVLASEGSTLRGGRGCLSIIPIIIEYS